MYLWDIFYFYQGSSGLVSYGMHIVLCFAKLEGQGQRRGTSEGFGPCKMMVTGPRRASGREQGEGESAKKCSPSG